MEKLDTETKLALHQQENLLHLTPLDLAADMCLPEIVMLMFRTKGVNQFELWNAGPYCHMLYDVTRYEKDLTQHYMFLQDLVIYVKKN